MENFDTFMERLFDISPLEFGLLDIETQKNYQKLYCGVMEIYRKENEDNK